MKKNSITSIYNNEYKPQRIIKHAQEQTVKHIIHFRITLPHKTK